MIASALRIAMIGDRGIPARYSGFSTLVEEVSTRLVSTHGFDVTVYCRAQYFDHRPSIYKGVKLVYLRAPGGKNFESLFHSARAIVHAALCRYDAVFVVDPGNGPLTLPLAISGTPFAIHTDGKGWQRTKWGNLQRRYYKWSEACSARLATWLVTDSPAMHSYYLNEYGARSTYIPYGSHVGGEPDTSILAEHGLKPAGYHLVVARLEPENNVGLIVREYRQSRAQLPLVYVGAARYESSHSREVLAQTDGRVRCIGAVYDAERLNALYANCRSYIHGHEVGGTNPSLLRAMGAGAACIPIDVVYHHEALGEQGLFFGRHPGELAAILDQLEADDELVGRLGRLAADRASSLFRWDAVADAYAQMMTRLACRSDTPTKMAGLAAVRYAPGQFTGGTMGQLDDRTPP